MLIRQLQLNDFRNYGSLTISFSEGVNLLYGDNAQGKTNLLEAICLSATTRAFRGAKDKELIRFGCDEAHIGTRIVSHNVPHRVDMHLRRNKPKGIAIDEIPIRRSAELLGLLHVISFCPDDLAMMKSGPSERRRFLDMELCQMDPVYCSNLINYNKVLVQRNNLLKQISGNLSLRDTLFVWDEQLVRYGREIIRRREALIRDLLPVVTKKHGSLSGDKETLTMEYAPNVSIDDYEDKLARNFEHDLFMKSTGVGPHRDDVDFSVNDRNVRLYGSQGQQRTAALALKLAEIELVRERAGEAPVLLLDDVLSELDRSRQLQLLSEIDNLQTIVTCTGMEEFVLRRSSEDSIYLVKKGTVEAKAIP
ncbi:MAG: DNA replication/repair protein RecF [Lachnospiraceae bacterium]|nr:DNA replication/repair protein RecF [Lachnospiraceae bacterium]